MISLGCALAFDIITKGTECSYVCRNLRAIRVNQKKAKRPDTRLRQAHTVATILTCFC